MSGRDRMEDEGESTRMLKEQYQPAARSSEQGADGSFPQLESQSPSTGEQKSIWSLYGSANTCATVRCLASFPMLGSAARIVSMGASPPVVPFGAYSLACVSGVTPMIPWSVRTDKRLKKACLHVVLISHRAVRPRSPTSPLPPQSYMMILAASPVILLAALVYGFTILALTKEHYDEEDLSRTIKCSKSASRRCHPKTLEGDAYDMTIVCTSFAFGAL